MSIIRLPNIWGLNCVEDWVRYIAQNRSQFDRSAYARFKSPSSAFFQLAFAQIIFPGVFVALRDQEQHFLHGLPELLALYEFTAGNLKLLTRRFADFSASQRQSLLYAPVCACFCQFDTNQELAFLRRSVNAKNLL